MLQPQVGVGITAAVTDPDGAVAGTTWKWIRSSRMTGPWDEISGATEAAYIPQDEADNDDRNEYLRAEATYTDGRGENYGEQKAAAVSTYKVSEARTDNTPPSFSQTAVDRNIPENTAAGMKIGAPVSAMDPDSGDILVYTLGGAAALTFSIDKETGQLMTNADAELRHGFQRRRIHRRGLRRPTHPADRTSNCRLP